MSSLIPERPLVFSATLAATIGLEEAILLHLLNDLRDLRAGETRDTWQQVDLAQLQQWLPFWQVEDIRRIALNLREKGVLQLDGPPPGAQTPLRFSLDSSARSGPRRAAGPARTLSALWRPDEDLLQLLALNHGIPRDFAMAEIEPFVLYWRDRGEATHAWASRFRQHVLRRWREEQSRQASRDQASAIGDDWAPSEDALLILQRAGIDRNFIEDAVAEFVLYWRERGAASSTWNSKFIAHIRRQWARLSASLEHDRDPAPISSHWQPSEDVFDILRMANIDLDFARELVPEFVLFWQDAGTPMRSWNSKFLQHVKYQWAVRHQMGTRYGGSKASSAGDSPFERLTDRSWASGLVEGL